MAAKIQRSVKNKYPQSKLYRLPSKMVKGTNPRTKITAVVAKAVTSGEEKNSGRN